MRLVPVLIALALLVPLASCHPVALKPSKIFASEAARRAAAEAGDSLAAFAIGDEYCSDEPAADHGRETLKWFLTATKGADPDGRVWGYQGLGNFYLARFGNRQSSFDPRHDAGEKRYCTGSRRSAKNDVLAEKYLRACARVHWVAAADCDENLGKLYFSQKKYAKAYEAFSYGAAAHENESYAYRKYFAGQLSDLPVDKQQALAGGWRNMKPYMQAAARHLTAAQKARFDAQSRTFLRRENARLDAREERSKVNR